MLEDVWNVWLSFVCADGNLAAEELEQMEHFRKDSPESYGQADFFLYLRQWVAQTPERQESRLAASLERFAGAPERPWKAYLQVTLPQLLSADGHLHPEEMALYKRVARKLNWPEPLNPWSESPSQP